jgi:uncharacterized protein YbjT (DUF2867 family)
MKVIIFGATGLAGSEVVKQALQDPEITEVVAVVRKKLPMQHPKLKVVTHSDYLDYTALQPVFRQMDACIWCLGISQTQVDEAQYNVITYDYALAAAKAVLAVNPDISFVFLSGQGAASSEKSMFLFGRVKGKTENALKALPFNRLFVARPAGIIPMQEQPGTPFSKKIVVGLMKLFISSNITAEELALALLQAAKHNRQTNILENKALKQMAAGLKK